MHLLHSPATVVEHLQQLVLVMDSEVGTAETRLFLLHSERILQAAKGSLVERRALASKETGGLSVLCRCLEVSNSWGGVLRNVVNNTWGRPMLASTSDVSTGPSVNSHMSLNPPLGT